MFDNNEPIIEQNNSSSSKTNDDMIIDNKTGKEEEIWIQVPGRIRRYKANILGINVPGQNDIQKLNNLTKVLVNSNGFIECKKNIFQRDLWLNAIFDDKQNMLDACEKTLFDGNDYKLTPLINRGDEEIKNRTLVIRDLPLDTDRNMLKSILESYGSLDSLKLRLSGSWFRADAIFKEETTIENNFINTWSIQYKKDMCRVAPASYNRSQIEERNSRTAKLTNLPYGTTPIDLKQILQEVKAKTCFIPRTRNRYARHRYAYVSFENDDDLEKIFENSIVKFGENELLWDHESSKACHKCGSTKHLIAECDERENATEAQERRKQYSNVYSRFKVPNYRKLIGTNNNRNAQGSPKQNVQNKQNFEQILTQLKDEFRKNFEIIKQELTSINERINNLEAKQNAKTPGKTNTKQQKKQFTGLYNDTFNKYIPTKDEYNKYIADKQLQENDNSNNKELDKNNNDSENKKGKQKEDDIQNNMQQQTSSLSNQKRNRDALSSTDNSSSDESNKKTNKLTTQQKSYKHVKFQDESDTNTEINSIKSAQAKMESNFNSFASNVTLQLNRLYEVLRPSGADDTFNNQ